MSIQCLVTVRILLNIQIIFTILNMGNNSYDSNRLAKNMRCNFSTKTARIGMITKEISLTLYMNAIWKNSISCPQVFCNHITSIDACEDRKKTITSVAILHCRQIRHLFSAHQFSKFQSPDPPYRKQNLRVKTLGTSLRPNNDF